MSSLLTLYVCMHIWFTIHTFLYTLFTFYIYVCTYRIHMEYMHLYTLSMCIEGLCKCMYVYIYMDVEYPRGEAEALHTLAA